MVLEVIVQSSLNFLDAALNILVHGSDKRRKVPAGAGLVVIIRVGPNHRASLELAQVHIIAETRSQICPRDLIEGIQLAGQKVLAVGIAPLVLHRAKTARSA